MKKIFRTIIVALLALSTGCLSPAPHEAGTVVLVHGLGRSAGSMSLLGMRLEKAGYRVVSFDYPSTKLPMEQLVDSLSAEVRICCSDKARDVHFVTHSMGGVLVRMYLSRQTEPHRGRVVMLSPPSKGSELVDAFADSELLHALLGPAGSRLGTDSGSVPSSLGPIRFQLGVIAGDRSWNPIFSWLIPGPDDGKVSVDRARVEGADFIVVPASHTFIMNRLDVSVEVLHFLRTGRFNWSGT